jgi:hypothetical protein
MEQLLHTVVIQFFKNIIQQQEWGKAFILFQ